MTQFPWPDGTLAAVALTFDMDGETIPYVVDRENARRRLSLMSEMAYGPTTGIYRILDLLDLYEIKATVFVPGRTAQLHPEAVKAVVSRGHDVGHHGYMHERPDSLADDVEPKVLKMGIEILRSITGQAPKGYRSPAGELKPSSPRLLVEHGIEYDSSLMGSDYPYIVPTERGDLIELPWYWHCDDWAHYGFVSVPPVGNGIAAPSAAFEVWSESFEGLYARGGLFNMVMHPFLAGRPAALRLLEKLIRFIRTFPNVWWAPLSEIAAHCTRSDIVTHLERYDPVVPEPRWIT